MEVMLRSAFASMAQQQPTFDDLAGGGGGGDDVAGALALLGSLEGAALAEAAQQRQLAAVTKQVGGLAPPCPAPCAALHCGAPRSS